MRKLSFLLMPLALAGGASAASAAAGDNLGKRTARPETAFAGIGSGLSDSALDAAVQAASAFPLGSLENPVRVGGPEGEQAYVQSLRCADGKVPRAAAASPGGTGGFGTVTDLVVLDCSPAAPGRVDLRLDLYHEGHVEDRAPAGFTLARR